MVLLNPRAVALAALACACLACDKSANGTDDPGSLTCPELTSRYFQDSADQGHYRVVSPNGGESYHTGDSLIVTLASGVEDGEALVQLDVRVGGVFKRGVLPGFANKAVDTRTRCHLGFRIPDSLTVGSGRIPLLADSVRVRIAWYNHEDFQDFSDGYFRIIK